MLKFFGGGLKTIAEQNGTLAVPDGNFSPLIICDEERLIGSFSNSIFPNNGFCQRR